MTDTHHTPLLIIGSGPAGYTAAIYAARAMVSPTLVSGLEPGGQLTITTDVENYPGFRDVIQGPWLMDEMREQALRMGTTMVSDIVVSLDLSQRPFVARLDGGKIYTADAVILATGAKAKWLGIESEKTFQNYGVSACATCDGFFYRGKRVAVIGGGNSAVEEALYLANLASSVTLVHRRDSLRAEKVMQERLLNHPKITVIWNHVVDEILGQDTPKSVTGLRIKDVNSGALQTLDVDGVFIAIGHAPETSLINTQLKLKENGYLWTAPDSTKTSIDGVFAAGDVTDDTYRQAVTAAGQGCMAALEAEKFLAAL